MVSGHLYRDQWGAIVAGPVCNSPPVRGVAAAAAGAWAGASGFGAGTGPSARAGATARDRTPTPHSKPVVSFTTYLLDEVRAQKVWRMLAAKKPSRQEVFCDSSSET